MIKLFNLLNYLWDLMRNFTGIRGRILLIHPLSFVSHFYAMLLQDENHRGIGGAIHTSSKNDVMYVNYKSTNFNKKIEEKF